MMRLLKRSGPAIVLVMAMVVTFSLTLTTGAHALLMLRYSDGLAASGPAVTINDITTGGALTPAQALACANGTGDCSTAENNIIASPTDGVFTSLVQIGTSSSPTPLLNFTSLNDSSGSGTLTVQLTDTDFTLPPGGFANLTSTFAPIPGSTATSVTGRQCADLSNNPFTCTPAYSVTGTGTVSYSNTVPFALTERVVLTFAGSGGSDFTFTSAATQSSTPLFALAVPQPSALLLLGLGLTGLWALPMLRASRRGKDE
jgi:hypothetical protein